MKDEKGMLMVEKREKIAKKIGSVIIIKYIKFIVSSMLQPQSYL